MPGWRALGDPALFPIELSKPPDVLPELPDLLAFAKTHEKTPRHVLQVEVRERFNFSELRYVQLVNRAIDDPAAWELQPELMQRLKQRRDELRTKRARASKSRSQSKA